MTPLLPAPLAQAALQSAAPILTIEEFIEKYQGTNAEYVDGVVKEPTMVWPRHGKICWALARPLGSFIEDSDLGHVMMNDSWFRPGPTKIRGGDLSYYSYERLPKGPVPDGELEAVPDLVAEVKSPSDRWGEIFAKISEYLGVGVRVVLVVDHETRTVSVFRDGAQQQIIADGGMLTIPDVLPGFSLPVARLFA